MPPPKPIDNISDALVQVRSFDEGRVFAALRFLSDSAQHENAESIGILKKYVFDDNFAKVPKFRFFVVGRGLGRTEANLPFQEEVYKKHQDWQLRIIAARWLVSYFTASAPFPNLLPNDNQEIGKWVRVEWELSRLDANAPDAEQKYNAYCNMVETSEDADVIRAILAEKASPTGYGLSPFNTQFYVNLMNTFPSKDDPLVIKDYLQRFSEDGMVGNPDIVLTTAMIRSEKAHPNMDKGKHYAVDRKELLQYLAWTSIKAGPKKETGVDESGNTVEFVVPRVSTSDLTNMIDQLPTNEAEFFVSTSLDTLRGLYNPREIEEITDAVALKSGNLKQTYETFKARPKAHLERIIRLLRSKEGGKQNEVIMNLLPYVYPYLDRGYLKDMWEHGDAGTKCAILQAIGKQVPGTFIVEATRAAEPQVRKMAFDLLKERGMEYMIPMVPRDPEL